MPTETSAEPLAVLRGVSKKRGATLALDRLDLTLPAGDGTAIVGESGSGKSTLLELLIGLLRPDAGSVRVLGERLDDTDLRRLRQRMGYAIQETALYPHLSVGDNVTLPARLAGIDSAEAERRCRDLAAMMNLADDMLARYPLQLSGGQQQRAGICRAMILQPDLLLLDEPFSGLDIVTRREIYERFLKLTSRDTTDYVLVTHDINEALALCGHLVVMNQGRVAEQGPTAAVLGRPESAYVRELVNAQLGHGRALG